MEALFNPIGYRKRMFRRWGWEMYGAQWTGEEGTILEYRLVSISLLSLNWMYE
jgi:hypothetical protein